MRESFGHYRLISQLGEGGMGEVYLAEDTRLERNVALKFLAAKISENPDLHERFIKEAKAASKLNHPNICVIHDVGETPEKQPFISMEWLEGETLDAPLSRGETFDVAKIIDVVAQVADALDAAHEKKIIHRDIKPANIHLDRSGRVKVLDFGLAKQLTPEAEDEATPPHGVTQPGTIMGTPSYMSPEQALARPVDNRSDLFSLGVVLYQLIAGRTPFGGGSFAEITDRIVHSHPPALARFNYDIPTELERITRKCLEKDAQRRYQSAREIVIDLDNLRRELDAGAGGSLFGDPDASLPTAAYSLGLVEPDEEATAEDLANSDIVISYAPVDDQPMALEKQGWISQFHRNLAVRVEQLSGERVRVWRHPGAADSKVLEEKILQHIPEAKTMISVVSPPFVKSEGCRRQVEAFWLSRQRLPRPGSQLFKVVKRPVAADEMPTGLSEVFSQLLDFDFYEVDAETGRVREFDDAFGQAALQRYHERVYDLAQAIIVSLSQLKRPETSIVEKSNGEGKTIYLATTTSDLQPERDRIRRELVARGFLVLPDKPLPLVYDELVSTVTEYLRKCQASIHPLGGMYGVVPEGAEQSILEVQNLLAARRSGADQLRRLIWIPKDRDITDARQSIWIEHVRQDPELHCGAEIVEDSLEGLKGVMVDMLTPRREPPDREQAEEGGPPRVYLVCDKRDAEAVEPIEDYLFDQGLEVSLPDFEADEAEAAEIHRQNLTDCDAAIIFYGAARHSWVDIKLRGLLKAAGYGRSRDLLARSVYIAPPFDRRKERFRTHLADVIRQVEQFDPRHLEPLVRRLKESQRNA